MARTSASWFLLLALSLVQPACAAASDADAPATEDDDVKGGLVRSDLPRGAFRARAEEVAQEWLDGNIMTGDARLDAGVLRGPLSATSLGKLAEKMIAPRIERPEKLGAPTIKTPAFSDAVLKEAAKVIAVDGFVYAPSKENIAPIEANVRELVGFLGDTSKLEVLTYRAKVEGADDEHDEVSLWLIVHRETRQFVAFYAREGSV